VGARGAGAKPRRAAVPGRIGGKACLRVVRVEAEIARHDIKDAARAVAERQRGLGRQAIVEEPQAITRHCQTFWDQRY
jgi:hypothetical protein